VKSICVIGSGISGSTVANLLSKKYKVDVYEKAKGIGGRSSHRRYLNKLGFDHGLQYISPKTSKFKKFCSGLQKKRVLKKWETKKRGKKTYLCRWLYIPVFKL